MKTKAQILQDLRASRTDLSLHAREAIVEWSPKRVVARSFQKHRPLWIGAAVAIGAFIIVKATAKPVPPRSSHNERDNAPAPAKKGGLTALLLTSLAASARRSILSQGRHWLQKYLQNQVLNRQVPDDSP